MNIPIAHIADYINNWITGMLEATENQSVESDKSYVVIKNWTNLAGNIVPLAIKGSDIYNSYNKHGMGQLPSWILRHENPEDFATRLFIYLTR